MQYRTLGKTGIQAPLVAFGAGPVAALMTTAGENRSVEVVRRALDAGIDWFDTAATYGGGQSERSLGAALGELGARNAVHLATKVRLTEADLNDIPTAVRESLRGSLERLGVSKLTLLQLHNAITRRRGDEPTSVTADDVLRSGGILQAMQAMQQEGLVEHLGLTGLGQPEALREVIEPRQFATLQTPYNVLNPSAGEAVAEHFAEANYGNLFAACEQNNMGVFAIRVFAGGALAGQPPSTHTHKTQFFPLDLFERDRRRGEQLLSRLAPEADLREIALRFAWSHHAVTSAIVGFGEPSHIDDAVAAAEAGPLPPDVLQRIRTRGG